MYLWVETPLSQKSSIQEIIRKGIEEEVTSNRGRVEDDEDMQIWLIILLEERETELLNHDLQKFVNLSFLFIYLFVLNFSILLPYLLF